MRVRQVAVSSSIVAAILAFTVTSVAAHGMAGKRFFPATLGRKIDAERFDTITPAVFFGKGFGDLPEALDFVKPVAVTGTFGVSIPTRHATKTFTTDEDGAVSVEREVNASAAKWGFSVQ